MKYNPIFAQYLRRARARGRKRFAFCGGRRSGKTYFVAQFLVTRALQGEVVNVASMTQTQGRLGAFADFCDIISGDPLLAAVFEVLTSPMEIRNKENTRGRIIFNSYQKSETAKGIACDWLFMNEANNFTRQHVIDLLANVRKGWIIDYNPSVHFWVDDYFEPSDICYSTWENNPFLTASQREYFYDLKRKAEAETATDVDIRNYRVNYLGEYYELQGGIFTDRSLRWVGEPPAVVRYFAFADPSALRGADYFAAVLAGQTSAGEVYIADAFSVNGSAGDDRESVARRLRDWQRDWGAVVYVETNGLVGIDFFEFAQNSGIEVAGWYSRGNKFERIVANYGNVRERMCFADTAAVRAYCQQVYDFGERCEHDDNIDAIVSAFRVAEFVQ